MELRNNMYLITLPRLGLPRTWFKPFKTVYPDTVRCSNIPPQMTDCNDSAVLSVFKHGCHYLNNRDDEEGPWLMRDKESGAITRVNIPACGLTGIACMTAIQQIEGWIKIEREGNDTDRLERTFLEME